jgi:pimeloyl-ACP methyl ester carboxylesterase
LPFVELPKSPHAPRVRPVNIHYRDVGSGRPVVFLHGGWGYRVYPIHRQVKAFGDRVRFLIPDRSGYGHSEKLSGQMLTDFHQRAAEETLLVLDAIGIERAIFWGHSDGAVIAALLGFAVPQRCAAHSRSISFVSAQTKLAQLLQTIRGTSRGAERKSPEVAGVGPRREELEEGSSAKLQSMVETGGREHAIK